MCKPAGALIFKRDFNKSYFTYIRSIKEQIFALEELHIEKIEAFPSSSLTNIHCIRIKIKVKRNFSQMRNELKKISFNSRHYLTHCELQEKHTLVVLNNHISIIHQCFSISNIVIIFNL